jgi:hypothetical protein
MKRVSQLVVSATAFLASCLSTAARCEEPIKLGDVLEIFEAVVDDLVPAPAPAKAVLQVNPREAQVKQIMPHFVQQLRPVLMSELAFIRQMCNVPKEQRPQIKAAGEASLEKAARQLAEQQFGGNRGMFGAPTTSDPRTTINDALVDALKRALTAEQMAEYTSEVEKRSERRKRAAILSAVALLDEVLWLTAEQRQAIYDSIAANWQPSWEQWLMLSRYGGQYFPMIPDQHVVAHFNEEQRRVWNGLQKINLSAWSGAEAQVHEDDGWWGDEPVKAAGPAEVLFKHEVIIAR